MGDRLRFVGRRNGTTCCCSVELRSLLRFFLLTPLHSVTTIRPCAGALARGVRPMRPARYEGDGGSVPPLIEGAGCVDAGGC